ncbi:MULTISPECIES: DUF438 domain-containing protein [unclassified Veillonella]|jgi:hypothetical protein|uniref:DUF438 domain-containing protein n=1 Tax=unclassified Veillonella TaxID=2630086 RepID=UPI002353EE8E|nr:MULTISPECIES: DUF438 domain-containing protein [unclassified Veillonella]MBS6449469.1 DUF438 domain-containing protein [Veillonella sp. oral taxon 158]MDU1130231.1 DUF438 domain-containing protein [Veillonella sp.]MDU2868921.1 DUF438 domain-containing protein [Veillonella sp.]
MEKKLDLSKSVYDLVTEYPEVVDIMKELGFSEITNKVMLNSVGKIMTIPKGAKMKGVSMIDIVGAFMKAGFTLTGDMPNLSSDDTQGASMPPSGVAAVNSASTAPTAPTAAATAVKAESVETSANAVASKTQENSENKTDDSVHDTVQDSERVEQLKSFLKRLGTGEELGAVREDFVSQFAHVEASEIMKAEQGLMREGTPLAEVQQLCDLHSALFHGSTIHEQMDAEHAKVEAVLEAQEKSQSVVTLVETVGHPLNRLTEENKALDALIEATKVKVASKTATVDDVNEVRQVSIHYAKKGDLLYPHLKVAYDISGPSLVMWTVDGDIRDGFGRLARAESIDDAWYEEFDGLLTRAQEMIYKEQNILFPICAENFSTEEWYQIYKDTEQYEEIFGVERVAWTEAESALAAKAAPTSGDSNTIALIGGSLTLEQLDAMLNTMPMEITFVDHVDINRYFNDGEKVFKRPTTAIGRDVFSCHPPKVEPIVRGIIESFRNGERDNVAVWLEKVGRPFYVNYMAVRDQNNNYLGTLELVQDMQFAKEYFARIK